MGAAALLGGAYDAYTAAAGFAGVTALAIAELSTTGTFAACMSCLLCRGLFSCGRTMLERVGDAWMQQSCSVRHMLCAQVRHWSAAAVALAIAGLHDGAAEKQQPVRFIALQRAQRVQPVCLLPESMRHAAAGAPRARGWCVR